MPARHDSWQLTTVQTALHELAREIHRLGAQVAAAHVDRARGIRDASVRAEDCTEHGADLRYERHQSYSFSQLADRHDAERLVWLTAVQQIGDALNTRTDQWATTMRAYITRVRRQAHKARDTTAPTLADCQRAGRCEHPATGAHTACQQLKTPRPAGQEPAGD